MAITKPSSSTFTTAGTKYDTVSAANTYMEPIATTLVGSGGASSITFNGIPQNYVHLQIRGLGQSSRATYGFDDVKVRFNGDTGTNYARHYLGGNGSTTYAGAVNTPSTYMYTDSIIGSSTAGTYFFGGFVMDILDYINQGKYKTVRTLGGTDLNGTVGGEGGRITLNSGLWMNTSPITSIVLTTSSGTNFNQYSRFSLYGLRG